MYMYILISDWFPVRAAQQILVFSLVCWFLFTSALAFIRPPAAACVMRNQSQILLYPAYFGETGAVVASANELLLLKGDRPATTESPVQQRNEELQEAGAALALPFKSGRTHMRPSSVLLNSAQTKTPANRMPMDQLWNSTRPAQAEQAPLGSSPLRIARITGGATIVTGATLSDSDQEAISRSLFVWPPLTRLVYRADEVDEVFVLLILLVLLGEFFAAPAVPLADAATICLLESQPDLYGRQRMFGSAGWAIAMALVGFALDRSTHFPSHPCAISSSERNYRICFQTFAVLMCLACFLSTRLKGFPTKKSSSATANGSVGSCNQVTPGAHSQATVQRSTLIAMQTISSVQSTWQPHQQSNANALKETLLEKWRSAVFAQRSRQLPNWLMAMKNRKFAALLLLACFMGFGVGLVFTFLFWHLQEIDGNPTLFGIASVINHLSEIGAYFHSFRYIRQYGRIKVIRLKFQD